ncbi:MAG: hypothetical protein GY765_38020 [bacterium]|nr:hypothetical protein [bacterium]
MKAKKISKKLQLNKETVSDLAVITAGINVNILTIGPNSTRCFVCYQDNRV